MNDTKSGDDKTLSVTPKKTLTLKPSGVQQSTVRQNFSHGRTNNVVVETKKRRILGPHELESRDANLIGGAITAVASLALTVVLVRVMDVGRDV